MLEALVGDTIGSPFEVKKTLSTSFELFDWGCRYTDDSVMAVAVAEWLFDDSCLSHLVLEEKMVKFGNLAECSAYHCHLDQLKDCWGRNT